MILVAGLIEVCGLADLQNCPLLVLLTSYCQFKKKAVTAKTQSITKGYHVAMVLP